MKQLFLFCVAMLAAGLTLTQAQTCTPLGDQTTYGTNDRWIGYVYSNRDFTGYVGYVNEGTPGNPFFDQSFGGNDVSYATNGCPVQTESFSVRYKLRRAVPNGTYRITVGGDDGYRFSVDGGATWVINKWNDQTYITTTVDITLSGTVDVVLEYYENAGPNRITLAFGPVCIPMENQATYGTNNVWRGYVYEGTNFNTYKGMVTEGNSGSPNFDQSFGGDLVTYNTSACGVTTDNFSMRYRLNKTFVTGSYSILVGGDAGYRLSLNGGSTWAVNNWTPHSYQTTSINVPLSGAVNMVLEYFDNSGGNRVVFSLIQNITLPVKLISFTGKQHDQGIDLAWRVSEDSHAERFEVERSVDGIRFETIGSVNATTATSYAFTDKNGSTSFYRLRTTDLQGEFSYSKVVTLQAANTAGIQVYPSVITGTSLTLESATALHQASLLVADANGRQVSQKSLGKLSQGQVSTIAISTTKLPAGMYFLQVLEGSEHITTKRIIVR